MDNNENWLVEGAEIHEHEFEKDDVRQQENLNAMAQALDNVTQDSKGKKESMQKSKNKWQQKSDESIQLYIEVTTIISEIKNNTSKENEQSILVFIKKIQKELERIEDYVYLDLASNLMELNDIKYVIKCLDNSYPRLQKLLQFLQNLKNQCIDKNQGYNDQFDMLMNLESKIQSTEPKIQHIQKQIREQQSALQDLVESVKDLRKSTQKKFKENGVWVNSSFIIDELHSMTFKVNQQQNVLKKMRQALYNGSLIDYAGQNNFEDISQNDFDDTISPWLQVPQNIGFQLQKIGDNIAKQWNVIEDIQKELQVYVNMDDMKRSQSFFGKLFKKSKNSTDTNPAEINPQKA